MAEGAVEKLLRLSVVRSYERSSRSGKKIQVKEHERSLLSNLEKQRKRLLYKKLKHLKGKNVIIQMRRSPGQSKPRIYTGKVMRVTADGIRVMVGRTAIEALLSDIADAAPLG